MSHQTVNYHNLRGIICIKTKPSSARIAVRISHLLLESRNFSLRKALPMSLSVAPTAAKHADKTQMADAESVRCMMLSVLPVEDLARFLSSRATIALFIAVNALAIKDKF